MRMEDAARPGFWTTLWRSGGLLRTLAVHEIRRQGSGAFGLLSAFSTPLLLCAFFWFVFEVIGKRGLVLRGDLITFLLTGIFLFFLCVRTQARVKLDGGKAMMGRAQPILRAWAGAISVLYVTVAAMVIVFAGNWMIMGVAELQDPAGVIAPVLVTWLFGLGAGFFLSGLSLDIGARETMNLVFSRVMFVTSGKFFVANAVPGWVRIWFDWNPLFHLVDQLRGAVFVNYTARHTSLEYPAAVAFGLMALGLMLARRAR